MELYSSTNDFFVCRRTFVTIIFFFSLHEKLISVNLMRSVIVNRENYFRRSSVDTPEAYRLANE